jgi:hypothetical protein
MHRQLARLAAATALVSLTSATAAIAQAHRPTIREAAARVSFAQPAPRHDSTANGVAIGALIGGGVMLTVLAVASSGCNAGCENDMPGWAPIAIGGIGAAGGAAVGYLVDKLHRTGPRKVIVMPAVTRRDRGVKVAVRF